IMRLWTCIILFPFICLGQNEGQARIDSNLNVLTQVKQDTTRVNLLNELAFSYQYKAPETGIKYGQEALQLAKNLKWPNGIAMANKNIGVNYSVTSDFSKALSYYEESLQSGAEDKIISYTLLSIGLIYTYQSNYPKAQEYIFKALKM